MKLWQRLGRYSVVAAFTWQASVALAVAPGDSLPRLAIDHLALDGEAIDKKAAAPLTNDALTQKVTIVNFWATWCAACKVEIKEFEGAFKELASHAKFQVAFVSLDKNPDDAKAWFEENVKDPNFRSMLYNDAKFQAAESLEVDAFPMTLVIDGEGKVRHIQRGFEEGSDSTEKIVSVVRSLL